ncbi:organic anion transporter 3-like [Argopecten irradians]|uniref:organic anion transporter 3-like n=1 Tax=Argopecten irradians TaxID=31199 RepID=UPI00371BAE76
MSSPTSKLFRPYQFKQMALTTLAVLPMAFHIVSVVFIGYTPEHACSIPMQLNRTNVDNSSTNDFTNATAEVCNIQWQHREDGQMINEETDCLYGVNYSVSKMHTFIAEWDLVCDREALGRISQSLVLGGMFLGALAAPLADKYGRKPVHVTFNIGLLIVTFAMAFVKSVPAFLVLRFFVGTFQQGMLITVVTFGWKLLHLDSRENV